MKRIWVVCSGICLLAAGVAILRHHVDAAFALAAIGTVAWFLDKRAEMQALIPKQDQDNDPEDENHDEI